MFSVVRSTTNASTTFKPEFDDTGKYDRTVVAGHSPTGYCGPTTDTRPWNVVLGLSKRRVFRTLPPLKFRKYSSAQGKDGRPGDRTSMNY